MKISRIRRAFTLIELLTVIAIIAVLAAILFPLSATVREQGRATSCMTKMHQLWVSANVYRQDEGGYPPSLFGYAEVAPGAPGSCQPNISTGVPLTNPGTQCAANLDRLVNGFLYNEQIKDANITLCPNNTPFPGKARVTVAYFPIKPANWPTVNPVTSQPVTYVTDPGTPVNTLCPSDANGFVDCHLTGPLQGTPKYYYVHDSYDIGPRLNPNGGVVAGVYDVRYSTDWTGNPGANDLPNQLKYANPPSERTLLTYCTWHAATYRSDTSPGINMAGTAKKISNRELLLHGHNVYNK